MASRFHDQLQRQLGFLERSCASYDAGFTDEAVRIAVVVRTLLHQTKSSTSLLTHLGATSITLLSTTLDILARFDGSDPFYPRGLPLFFNGMGRYGGPSGYTAKLGDASTKELIPMDKWWSQPVVILDRVPVSRRDIVLAAANKDGGAHVDASLTPEYESLSTPGSVGVFVSGEDAESAEAPITDAHLVSLRQMGYELLNSPDLRTL